MIHKMSVVLEFTYDDEDGEYSVPSTREVEQMIERSLYRGVQEMGFSKEVNIEAAHGDLEDAFGIEGYDDDDDDVREIRDVTPNRNRRKNKR